MKKVKWLSVLASVMMAGALVFSGCSNDSSDPAPLPTPTPTPTPVYTKITLLDSNNAKVNEFEKIQEAINAINDSGSYTIMLPKGTYNENYINYNGAATIKLCGNTTAKYGADVIITGHGSDMGKEKGRELVEFMGSSSLILENLTLLSDYSRETVTGDAQAEVLGFDSTGIVAAYNCSFKSHQDTMRTTGKGWFYKCYVEGDTDFIWMESAGLVALYEECEIVSVYDKFASTHAGYVLAPRVNVGNVIGKGAVIFNSKVKFENDSNFLFRNPWGTNKDYYNNGAFVGCTFEVAEGKTLEPALAKSAAMGTSDQQFIGWKLDKALSDAYTSKMSSIGTISDDLKAKEYSGRKSILNRNYNIKNEAFAKDVDSNWDIDAFIVAQKWTVTPDTSKDIYDDEKESKVTILDFTKEPAPEGVTLNGFAKEAEKAHYVGQKDATISFKVPAKSTVAVTGYYAGNGTISAEGQGAAYYNFNNGSTSKFATKEYIVYAAEEKTVTITATKTTYVTSIKITQDDQIKYTPVASIAITAADNKTEIFGKKTLQMTAVVSPSNASNTDFDWSVSDTTVATIDENGVLTAADVAADATVNVIATAKDPNTVSKTYTLTVKPLSATSVDLTWLDTLDDAAAEKIKLDGTSSNTDLATAGKAVLATTGVDEATGGTLTGAWKYNSSKMTGTSKTGISLVVADADPKKGEWYVEYPVTAATGADLRLDTLRVYWGNPGTGNYRVYAQFIDENGAESVIYDKTDTGDGKEDAGDGAITPRASGSTGAVDFLELPLGKVVTKGKTAKVRVSIHGHRTANKDDSDPSLGKEDKVQSFSGKAPTWGKTIISATAGSFPIAGQTYEINLSSADNLKAAGSDKETEFFSWTGANPGSGHGLQSGKGTLKVPGKVQITVGLCRYGSGTITFKNAAGETVKELTVVKMAACCSKGVPLSFTADNSQNFVYEGDAGELTVEWSSQVYLEGIKMEPAN